jgi:hypothetical protein
MIATPTTPAAEQRSASIIPFPRRVAPECNVVPSGPDAGKVRLTRALEALEAALDEQKIALAVWRKALTQLKTTTGCLEQSLNSYQSNLWALRNGVSSLGDQARSLEQWAEKAGAQ